MTVGMVDDTTPWELFVRWWCLSWRCRHDYAWGIRFWIEIGRLERRGGGCAAVLRGCFDKEIVVGGFEMAVCGVCLEVV
jgi:hypothetical protein